MSEESSSSGEELLESSLEEETGDEEEVRSSELVEFKGPEVVELEELLDDNQNQSDLKVGEPENNVVSVSVRP